MVARLIGLMRALRFGRHGVGRRVIEWQSWWCWPMLLSMGSDRDRVRDMWRELALAPLGFGEDRCVVVAADGHRAAPAGWVGVIELEGSVVVAAPSVHVPELSERVTGTVAQDLTHAERASEIFAPVMEDLGPALLFYGVSDSVVAGADVEVIGPVPASDERVQALFGRVAEAELGESGVGHLEFVFAAVDPNEGVVGVCGWETWPHGVAHLGVLTSPSFRGCGIGAAVAARAVGEARSRGLVPQWRAAEWNSASVALASKLGLRQLGRQFSLRR